MRETKESALDRVFRLIARAGLHDHVRIEIHNAKVLPKRSKVRANMKKLRKHAQQLQKTLERVTTGLGLMALPIARIDDLAPARAAIEKLVELADLTLKPAKAGREKEPGMTTCALIVIEAWHAVTGEFPGRPNRGAHDACEQIWRACGGDAGNRSRWERHMKEAREARSPMLDFIRAQFDGAKADVSG